MCRDSPNRSLSVCGSDWVLEREIKNEQEVLGQFLRALRNRKPSGRGCVSPRAHIPLPPPVLVLLLPALTSISALCRRFVAGIEMPLVPPAIPCRIIQIISAGD